MSCVTGFRNPPIISTPKNTADQIFQNAFRYPLKSEYEKAFFQTRYEHTPHQIAQVWRQKIRALGRVREGDLITLPTTILLNDHEYSITKMLGSGSHGIAYDAISPSGETVVIKISRKRTPLDVESFKREHWALEKTGNLIESDSILLVIVQKKYEGEILFDALNHMSPREINAIKEKYMQLGREFYERNGFFHGDIAPRNVIILPDGSLHLIDFGRVQKLNPKGNVDYYLSDESYYAFHEFELALRAWNYFKNQSDLTTLEALSAIENYMDELTTTGREIPSDIRRDLRNAKMYNRFPWLKKIIGPRRE